MKYIGDLLEIGLKHEIIELYAILETSLNRRIEYNTLLKRNFGTVLQNILDKGIFQELLKTQPNNIKLSDWRNIAYHHTYEIEIEKIKCSYGKQGNFFTITLEELIDYCTQIVKALNIIDIGRRMFFYDNMETFREDFGNSYTNYRERDEMKIGQLRTAMLSQGFKLVDIKVNSSQEEAIIWDIKRDTFMNDEEKTKREIHCSQFLHNIWLEFPADKISITYCDSNGTNLYCYSINGQVCKAIVDGELELRQMLLFLNIKKLDRS